MEHFSFSVGISECGKATDGGNVEQPRDLWGWAFFCWAGEGFSLQSQRGCRELLVEPTLLSVSSV